MHFIRAKWRFRKTEYFVEAALSSLPKISIQSLVVLKYTSD